MDRNEIGKKRLINPDQIIFSDKNADIVVWTPRINEYWLGLKDMPPKKMEAVSLAQFIMDMLEKKTIPTRDKLLMATKVMNYMALQITLKENGMSMEEAKRL